MNCIFKKEYLQRIKKRDSYTLSWPQDSGLKSLILVMVLILQSFGLGASVTKIYSGTVVDSVNMLNATHPRILVSNESKSDFLQSIKKVDWKRQLVDRKKLDLEKYIDLCKEDTDWLVSRLQMNWKTRHSDVYLTGGKFTYSDGEAPVPTVRYSGSRDWATDYLSPELEEVQPYFDDERGMYLQRKDDKQWEWVKPAGTGHIIEGINGNIMRRVADAAFLYWLTGDMKYAEFATPVFFQYMEGMHHRNPPTQIDDSDQKGLSGLATFEVIHESIVLSLALTYDFLYDYFIDHNQDLTTSQAVFQKWGDQIIKNGVPNNNWNLFQARFLTYIAMVLEDDASYDNGKGQQYYLKNTFDLSSERQIALKESILVYDQDNGIWPESPSYSMHVTTTLLEILTLLDHLTNENALANFPIVEKASLAVFQYLFPNGYTVGFGDSNHRIISPKIFELLISNYRKYGQEEKEERITSLLKELIQKEAYDRGGSGLFELFFYVDKLMDVTLRTSDNGLITPTFYAPGVSMFIQRLGTGDNAMMISTVGAFGNHAHANGIAMELYANNYVLGPDMGRGPSYWHSDHRDYYSQFPAHNTVVVDGISTYRSMRSYNPYTLDNCFPASETIPLFDKVTFSKASFLEPKTMSNQQRITTQIRSGSGQVYAVDIFRSGKIKDTVQTHDYIYHNLGQELQLLDKDDQALDLLSSEDLASEQGLLKAYDYFTNEKRAVINDDFRAVFKLIDSGGPDNMMKLWIKGQPDQRCYTVFGPESRAISKGTAPSEVVDAPIPAVVIRRKQDAWNKPFVVVYNPSIKDQQDQVSSVDFREDEYGSQKITVGLADGYQDIILAGLSEQTATEIDGFQQKGVFSVTRLNEMGEIDFIMVSGMNVFRYKGWEVISEGEPCTVTIERVGGKLQVQNNKPVLLRIGKDSGFNPLKMGVYADGKLVSQRDGKVSRFNDSQVEFRLAHPYDKVIIE